MGFNEAIKNLNVQKYLEEKDGLGYAGIFNVSSEEESKRQADLLAHSTKIQEKNIAKALKKGRNISVKQAKKEAKEIIDKGNKNLKEDFKKLDEIAKKLPKEFKSKGGGDGGGAGPR